MRRASNPKYRVVSTKELVKGGRTYAELLKELISLDYKTIGNLNERTEGTKDQWIKVFSKSPESIRYLVDSNNKIAGYWHYVALRPSVYKMTRNGKLVDSMLTAQNILRMENPGVYNIYWVVITLIRPVRHTKYSHLLKAAIFRQLAALARRKIYVNEMCANVFTAAGGGFFKSIGMYRLAKARGRGVIYVRTIYPFDKKDRLLRYKALVTLYKKKFRGW
jgi:hypothetical protein